MNGVEFLEQAIDLLPHARRRPADRLRRHPGGDRRDQRGRLDHYLLKPWDPPEEKLYPVVDDLLDAWQRDRRPDDGIQGRRSPLVARRTRSGTSWPATRCRTAGGRASPRPPAAGAGEPTAEQLPPGAHHRRRAPGRAHRRRGGRPRGAQRRAGQPLLRPGGGRRRPGRPGGGRVRRVGGPAHGPGRARRDRRAGRPELADRELPRLSPTASRGAAHRRARRQARFGAELLTIRTRQPRGGRRRARGAPRRRRSAPTR